MLITFSTPAYADITMFGDIARRLIRMMGHSGTVPSAILAEDVPDALDRLRRAVEKHGHEETGRGNDDDAQSVSLVHRALPLIKLLEAAAEQERDVMWDGK
jgi:hypothetical protein